MVRVDVPLNKEGDELIFGFHLSIRILFGDGVDDRGKKKGVHIDLKVFNRARNLESLWQFAAKGNNTPGTPHRNRGVVSVPEKIVSGLHSNY